MANFTRNFIAGRMNKIVDQRLLPEGEYIDAMNIRMGSTENSEVGVIENTKGNLPLTSLTYIDGTPLSASARCIGAIEDSANETIYWFVHDSDFSVGATGKLDLIVSFNVFSNILTYHVISINDGGNVNTVLNFNENYLITGVDILNDLLFFTDDYNAPRFININRNYANPISNIDQVTAESLLVVKKPPVESPAVQPIVTNGQENYLNTRFICFAYRYQYIDGEYSATSQWSQPAFVPNPFSFSVESFLNEGMTNFCNSAIITYNSGSSLVIGIDLLFKRSDGIVIKVIEKLNKHNLGLANNTDYQYTFTNSKIFTILPESELLRLYDNVPRYAKAQTIMGNRLMYGNYVEGYDLVDEGGSPIKFEYTTNLISSPIGNNNIDDGLASGNYSINGSVNIANATVTFDLAGQNLVAGSAINVEVGIAHAQFTGTSPYPTEITDEVRLNFAFFLSTTYTSVYALATSIEFQNAVGTAANIQPVSTACTGTTFTDSFNCAIPNNLNAFTKNGSGISAVGQPVAIITSPASSVIGLQFPAMRYANSASQTIYEYYSVTIAEATFQEIANPQSLHSNRDYEIGIVYMDEFNRATTALVSPNNTEHVPCGLSAFKNSIQVVIPPTQHPPAWATRYKFVIKPDEENYETIYCSIFFQDPLTNNAYFLLEGENSRKIEVGDRLIVKADSNGATTSCVYATVLEKSSQASNFIEIKSELDPTVLIPIPAGVYMKINPNSFNIVQDELAIIAPGKKTERAPRGSGPAPILYYPMNRYDTATSAWVDYSVPAGSRIVVSFKQTRGGVGDSCEERRSMLEKTLIASNDYDNMYDWWVGDDVEQFLNDGSRYAGAGQCVPDNKFIAGITNTAGDILTDLCINYYKFYRNTSTNQLQLMVTGTFPCTGIGYPNARASDVEVNITVFRSDKTLIFETQPSDALPDVFFENELSLPIINGNHMGNIQDQDITLSIPAIVDTKFFNCFAFGNGAESYKIRDSIVGGSFNFGNRVTSVSAQDYKESDRLSDITYSGIYNAESNVNKLNEFNLGLLNYKHLESSFGEIFMMDGRQTDVLALQEDKISYVLAGKNLLSDSTGGGAVTSVPEVLGTQIARTEKYGISFNPESYVQWGYDRYFTDVKRGVVLQLRGNSYSNDELKVVSEMNMRTWFRDNFNETFNTQKLGGFDPYMNEYVLSSNTRDLPYNPTCLGCGISQAFTLSTLAEETKTIVYCVDLGPTIGLTDINYNLTTIAEGSQFEIAIDYDGTTDTTGWVSTDGTLTFDKNNVSVETVTITINYTGDMVLNVLANCCQAATLTIVQVVLTNDYDSGDTIHTQYRYVDGAFVSPLQSSLVTFASGTDNPLVSRYNVTTNYVGTGAFPPAGSTMTLISNQFSTDTFVFNPATDKFKYLVSSTLYSNNSTDISTMLGLATTATPNQGGGTNNFADFTVPALNTYLYLIWDFRASIASTLCYSDVSATDACCGCGTPIPESYNCIAGTCVDPGDGTGTYPSLAACELSCSAPTTVQLDWNVGNQSGGALTVFNNVGSQLLNITSTAGSVQSGTIYPLLTELPYTIRGEWVSGSGNIIHFNLCDVLDGGTIYTSAAITIVEEYEDYLVNPTPLYALVNLRAQNVAPPTCPV
jgi:hypothetical protein